MMELMNNSQFPAMSYRRLSSDAESVCQNTPAQVHSRVELSRSPTMIWIGTRHEQR